MKMILIALLFLAGCRRGAEPPAPVYDCRATIDELSRQLQQYQEWESEPVPRADVWHDRRRVIDGRFLMCHELKTVGELKLSCQVIQ